MNDMNHFDELETRRQDARDTAFFAALGAQLKSAKSLAPFWAEQLKDMNPDTVLSRADLAGLPVLRKTELMDLQKADMPFGGLATVSYGEIGRVFMSPGPIFEPEGKDPDWWGVARALYAAGGRPGDLIHNTFAYHMTPAGHMFENGALAMGCTVFPAGTGNTDQQVEAINLLKPRGYTGTPDFLKVLLDRADTLKLDISSIQFALVSAAALPQTLRLELGERGVPTVQCYGTAELGIVAYEAHDCPGMIVNEDYIVEIVQPGTGDPVAEGDVGEVVVTRLNNDFPMLRFATGDLSAVLPGKSPCGRSNMRIKGWMGRADQTTKVKGMFIRPEQVAAVARAHDQIGRIRFVVTRENEQDVLTVKAEKVTDTPCNADAVEETVQSVCKIRGAVEFVAAGSLPNDGIVIADERSYD